jgi:alkylated DNA nucleotide flippase Atl1
MGYVPKKKGEDDSAVRRSSEDEDRTCWRRVRCEGEISSGGEEEEEEEEEDLVG